MPTALEQQAQFQQILRDSLAPVFEYNANRVRTANLESELRNRADISDAALKNRLQIANIEAASHLANIREQTEGFSKRLDAKDRELRLRKYRSVIRQGPNESDEEYVARVDEAIPSILDNADSNISALQQKSLDVSRRADAENLARARAIAANSLRTFLDPAGANQIVALLEAGKNPAEVIALAKTDAWGPHWITGDRALNPKEQNDRLAEFSTKYEEALTKPQYSDALRKESAQTEEELKKALATRETLRSGFPEAVLNQAAKNVTTLPALDVKSLTSGGKSEISKPAAPPVAAVVPRSVAPVSAPPEFQSPTYTRGLLPSIAAAASGPLDYVRAGASLIPVARQNLGTMLTGGNYVNPFSSPEIEAMAQRKIGTALGDYISRLGAPAPAPSPSLADQFGRFVGAFRNPFAAQQIPAELTTVPNPAPSPDQDALMREIAPYLFQQ